MTLSEIAAWLIENDRYLIMTHRRPDGDTLASAAALALGLKALGKTVYLYPNAEIAGGFRILPGHLMPEGYASTTWSLWTPHRRTCSPPAPTSAGRVFIH